MWQGGGCAWWGGVCGRGHGWQGEHARQAGGVHGGGGHAWKEGMCMVGVHAWPGGLRDKVACMAGGHAWQGACMAGEMSTAADGMHPTGMH